MAIDLENKQEFQNSQKLLKEFSNMSPNASDEEVKDKYTEYMNAYSEELAGAIRKDMKAEQGDNVVLNARNVNRLTNEEKKFYNALVSEDQVNTDVGYKEEALLPETVIDRVFDDIETDHPLLKHINIQRTGLKARVIKAHPEGQVVWGKIFSEIRGQLDATFSEQDLTLGKATAFVVIPKDLKDAGVQWVDRFVRAQIKEAFAVAIEKTALVGAGKSQQQPAGLMKTINRQTGAVTDKAAVGTLTFANPETSIKELGGVIAGLSQKEIYDTDGSVKDTKNVSVLNNVVIALNPADYIYTQVAFMQLTSAGQFASPVPFNVIFEVSEFVPQGKAVAFDKSRYFMGVGSEVIVRQFDQTLALEDCDLYTAKQFAYGETEDEKASAVYNLNLSASGAPTTNDSPEA
ncbi:phage major capsid protein [Staphylococcus capitis]|uniref:Phage major capsid protein n=1 Tax=Staphylococcus capitis TaxID=29388 RepID=A0A848EXW2_STACP|nr:phage major capsid protein [Staphylococcus capitis]MDS0178497.1 phage major capsid protein [Staphylococcus capitis]MDS0191419.1 phage major capsid protein [Staphylococcus capitis]MDS0196191.1 phage major capsid protein [Staphylococcus capitis]MDS0230500.1 phage major capsid protein [Staphylococcus capitis]MDS0263013.1 phage major capsid protein [Staphylococcus capitis]